MGVGETKAKFKFVIESFTHIFCKKKKKKKNLKHEWAKPVTKRG